MIKLLCFFLWLYSATSAIAQVPAQTTDELAKLGARLSEIYENTYLTIGEDTDVDDEKLRSIADLTVEIDFKKITLLRQPSLTTLTPLARLSFQSLVVEYHEGLDFNALNDRAIHELQIHFLTSLEPIAGLQVSDLSISNSEGIVDLSPLTGKSFNVLSIAVSDTISDLTPLAGIQAEKLQLIQLPLLTDLSPLSDAQISDLKLSKTSVTDFSPLSGTPITRFSFGGTLVPDLSTLSGMPISHLDLSRSPISDLRPLSGMQLTHIDLRHTEVTDLEPLRGMPLKSIKFEEVSEQVDFEPLKDSVLEELEITFSTPDFDLTPLKDLPINSLILKGTTGQIDVSALKDAPLRFIQISSVTNILGLESLPQLSEIEFSGLPNFERDALLQRASADPDLKKIRYELAKLGVDAQSDDGVNYGLLISPDVDLDDQKLETILELAADFNVTGLQFAQNSLTTLEPLTQLKLTNLIIKEYNDALDLSALHSLNLEMLSIQRFPSLEPLAGLQVPTLFIEDSDNMVDLTPLAGMLVSVLVISNADGISDLSPLAGMNFSGLYLYDMSALTDLGGLSNITVEHLSLRNIPFKSLEPLRGRSLRTLDLYDRTIPLDLEPLKNSGLENLSLGLVTVDIDLSPLQQLPLVNLFLKWSTGLIDVSVLADTPLKEINVTGATNILGLEAFISNPDVVITGLTEEQRAAALERTPAEQKPEYTRDELIDALAKVDVEVFQFQENDYLKVSPDANLDDQKLEALVEIVGGFDIEGLQIFNNTLTTLEPLTRLALKEVLIEAYHDGLDLSALQELNLEALTIGGITSIVPLTGLQIPVLSLPDSVGIFDLSPLAGMSFEYLSLSNSNTISDLTPLAGTQIQQLELIGMPSLTDLSPLKDTGLEILNLRNSTADIDLSPLKHLPIQTLNLSGTTGKIDVSVLAGTSLSEIDVEGATGIVGLEAFISNPDVSISGLTEEQREALVVAATSIPEKTTQEHKESAGTPGSDEKLKEQSAEQPVKPSEQEITAETTSEAMSGLAGFLKKLADSPSDQTLEFTAQTGLEAHFAAALSFGLIVDVASKSQSEKTVRWENVSVTNKSGTIDLNIPWLEAQKTDPDWVVIQTSPSVSLTWKHSDSLTNIEVEVDGLQATSQRSDGKIHVGYTGVNLKASSDEANSEGLYMVDLTVSEPNLIYHFVALDDNYGPAEHSENAIYVDGFASFQTAEMAVKKKSATDRSGFSLDTNAANWDFEFDISPTSPLSGFLEDWRTFLSQLDVAGGNLNIQVDNHYWSREYAIAFREFLGLYNLKGGNFSISNEALDVSVHSEAPTAFSSPFSAKMANVSADLKAKSGFPNSQPSADYVSFAMNDIEFDDGLWNAIDFDHSLSRDLGRVFASMRIDHPKAFELNTFIISLLGSEIEAKGKVDFTANKDAPKGRATITLKRIPVLVGTLNAMSLLPAQLVTKISDLLALVALPHPSDHNLQVSEFVVSGDGSIILNGEKFP